MSAQVEAFFDKNTSTLTYVVYSPENLNAIIIDPVWDFDYASGELSLESANQLIHFVDQKKLNVKYILETHVHADHITGSQKLKCKFPNALIGINENIKLVQKTFKEVLNLKNVAEDGSQFDLLLKDNQVIDCEGFELKVLFTPGHTPACTSFLIEDNLFTGDAMFMPDSGTGRCDFPKGDAKALYHSIKDRIYSLPDETKIYVGHDYQPNGRELKYQSTVKEQKENNIQLTESTNEEDYVEFRTTRDATLNAPKLLLPSIQINMDGGMLPQAEDNGSRYLKIPISEK